MRKIKRIKLNPIFQKVLKTLAIIFCIFLGIFIFYEKQIYDLTKIGYSRTSSKNILFSKNKDYVMSIGENKTLNLAFESNDFDENNLENYSKIKYVPHKHLIQNINKLLKIGYSNSDINIILSHGTDESVSEFTKRDKVRYLEEFFSFDFAKLENYDRYVQYSDETGDSEYDTVLYVNLNLDQDDYSDPVTVSKFSLDMLVNKHRQLKEDFVPSDLTTIDAKYASDDALECSRLALNAFVEMYEAAEKDGYHLVINSSYRSYQDQVDLTELYLKTYGQSYVDKYVAKPGFSEHQTGLAFDIGSRDVNIFANSKEYTWMQDNAYRYGFVLRFDKRYEDLTGFRSEPWHYRYVGKDIAKYIYEHNNMALEEYYAIFLDK